jgi:hypothetical protein
MSGHIVLTRWQVMLWLGLAAWTKAKKTLSAAGLRLVTR